MALDLVAGKASLEVRALSRVVLGWRTKRGWSLSELGERVGFSAAKLSYLCRAAQRISPREVVTIGAACGASDEEVELCVRVAQRAIDPQMWDRINGGAWARLTWTPWNVMAEASELVIVTGDVLPELVRVEAYNAALVEAGAAANDLDSSWQKDVLSRRRLSVRLIVSESALSSSVGGARVMADQLGRLEELSELPGFEFRVADGGAGPYFGMGTPFIIMRFVEKRFDDVVLVHTLHGGDTWLESAAERAPYERALAALGVCVHTKEESFLRLSQASLLFQDLQLVGDRAGS